MKLRLFNILFLIGLTLTASSPSFETDIKSVLKDSTKSLEQKKHEIKKLSQYYFLQREDSLAILCYRKLTDHLDWLNQLDSATVYCQKVADLSRHYHDYSTARTYELRIAYYDWTKGKLTQSLHRVKSVLIDSDKNNDLKNMELAYNRLGIIYYSLGDYQRALENYRQSIKITKKINPEGVPSHYIQLGNIYNKYLSEHIQQDNTQQCQLDFDSSFFYHSAALSYFIKTDRTYPAGVCYINFGELLVNVHRLFRDSIDTIHVHIEDQLIPLTSQKTIELIEYYANECLKINELNPKNTLLLMSKANLGIAQFFRKNHSKAIHLLEGALRIAKIRDNNNQQKYIHQYLHQAYEANQNYREALSSFNELQRITTILNQTNHLREFGQLESELSFERKLLEKEKAALIQQQQEEKKTLLLYFISFIMLLLGVFTYSIIKRLKITKQQKEIITQKNELITESIDYAYNLQQSILPSENQFKPYVKELFILNQPKDIVSGDFYYLHPINEKECIIALIDCTGHGVPGGFMSMMSYSFLDQIIQQNGIIQPDLILIELNNLFSNRANNHLGLKDSLEIGVLYLNKETMQAQYCGTSHKLFHVNNADNHLNIIKGAGYQIGAHHDRNPKPELVTFKLRHEDYFYMTSDGYIDQFGGAPNPHRKLGTKKFKEIVVEASRLPLKQQRNLFLSEFNEWRKEEPQIDDVLVMGIKI